ncbi:MAG TPA: DNA polymerase III subunit beta [Candidatus Omnitrophica bacterium]|nr:DNA polymerase III subunit beta [Candidatus Omnitrophota bacterium]
MKIKVNKSDLLKGVQVVGNIITPKNMLPILSNILFESQKNKIRLTTTDLDMGISYTLDADIIEPGAITIPTKRLSDVIKELPEGMISLITKKNNVVDIQSENCEFKLMGLPKEEFPKIPEFKDKEEVVLEQALLKQMLQMTSFAVSHEETRYVLNGLLLELKSSGDTTAIKLVGTDGRRLAVAEKKLPIKIHKDIKIIVPFKTIQELARNLKEDGSVSVIITQNQVFFEMEGIVIISRLIEGDFPDYQKVIPAASSTKIKLDREQFVLVLRRANLFTTPDFQAVRFELFKNKLVVSKSTPDVGEFKEEISAEYGGKEFAIGFNPAYLLDMLKSWREDEVNLEFYDAEKPGVVRSSDYIYILQPMRLG